MSKVRSPSETKLRSLPPDKVVVSEHAVDYVRHASGRLGGILTAAALGFDANQVVMMGHGELIAQDKPRTDEEKYDVWRILEGLRKRVVQGQIRRRGRSDAHVTIFFKQHGWYSPLEPLRGVLGPEKAMMALFTWGTGRMLCDRWAVGFAPSIVPYLMRHEQEIITVVPAICRVTPKLLQLFQDQQRRIWNGV